MDDPKKKILEMVASGKISVEEASALLDKLDDVIPDPKQPEAPEDAGQQARPVPPPVAPEVTEHPTPRRARYLRVHVQSSDGDEVNVRVPFSLIKTGIKLGSLLPREASQAIDQSGVDLSKLAELDGEELIEALSELQVDVESGNGDVVHVFCE